MMLGEVSAASIGETTRELEERGRFRGSTEIQWDGKNAVMDLVWERSVEISAACRGQGVTLEKSIANSLEYA